MIPKPFARSRSHTGPGQVLARTSRAAAEEGRDSSDYSTKPARLLVADRRVLLEAVWTGRGKRARTARALLAPAEAIYRVVVTARGMLYDWGVFSARFFPFRS